MSSKKKRKLSEQSPRNSAKNNNKDDDSEEMEVEVSSEEKKSGRKNLLALNLSIETNPSFSHPASPLLVRPSLPPFRLEREFSKYEFAAQGLLSCSDVEPLTMDELLSLTTDEMREKFSHLWLGYTDSHGNSQLREEIVQHFFTAASITAENVQVLTPEEGIYVTFQSLLNEGDHVIVVSPAYQSLYQIALSKGCTVTPWPVKMDKANNRWTLDTGFLELHLSQRTKFVVINSPHNPTSFHLNRDELNQIITVCQKHNLYLFSDEMYRFLELEEKSTLPSAAELYDKAISLGGLSKSFGLPGLRIGWLATQDYDAMQAIRTYKDYTTICNSAPSEFLAIIACKAKDAILERNLKIVRKNVQVMNRFFERFKDTFAYVTPTAASVTFVQLLKAADSDEFCEDFMNATGVMLLSSSVFGVDRYLRIGFGRRDFATQLQKLEDYLQSTAK